MRDAETVLAIIHERGKNALPLEDVYRQLYNPALYLRAYGRISRNAGILTRGTTEETADGMSVAKINAIIEKIRYERYRWTSVRRTYIPKKNGKTRPLGIPIWSDKLLQEVMRSLLDAYYEPQFSDCSHGFRPGRGCHTALGSVYRVWHGTKWFIEGDIKGCFDNIDHEILLSTLREKIHDNRFLRLTENLLRAGYLEQWNYHPTLSGTPQGGIFSPLLSNIYLDRLDRYVEETLLPEYNCEDRRKPNPAYTRLNNDLRQARREDDVDRVKLLTRQRRQHPTRDPHDPNYRRLRYVRYADDFLLGFAGPKAEAEEIKTKLRDYLRDNLKLELSEQKTLITHATQDVARFLGYEIFNQHCNHKITVNRRSINGSIGLRMPLAFVKEKSQLYMAKGKSIHRSELVNDDDFTIISHFQSEYRGYVLYYLMAQNVYQLGHLRYIMETALLKTLAAKHKSSVVKMAKKYGSTRDTAFGKRACLKLVIEREGKNPLIAVFGGIPLRRNVKAVIEDKSTTRIVPRNELLTRLLADECEICGSTQDIEVHHIRKLADLTLKGRAEKPLWMQTMSARKRKTLVLCHKCHVDLHAGRPLKQRVLD